MPRTLMGVPADARGLAESGVHLRAGLARVALEPACPPPTSTARTSASAGWSRSGSASEVVDRLVEPLLGGVYAGHAREISARAAVPQVVALLDRDRSMMQAAAAAPAGRRPTCRSSPGSSAASASSPRRSPRPRAWTSRTGATVRDLARAAEGGWNLVVGPTRDAEVLHADAVVLATPAAPTARLLGRRRAGRGAASWPGSSTPRWRSSPSPSGAATSPTAAGLGVPGAAGRRARRSRRRRSPSPSGTGSAPAGGTDGVVAAALLDRPAPRGAAAAARRRGARRSSRWPTSPTRSGSRCGRSTPTCSAGAARCRSTPSATSTGSRRIRAAVAAARARGVRGGVRRAGHPGLHRLRRRRGGPGPGRLGRAGRMNP